MQLRRNKIRLSRINDIFISHTHGDHVFGLYGLLSTYNLIGRKSDLRLYAPENFGPLLRSHLNDFDIHLNYNLIFIPLKGNDPVKIFENKHITVTSFPLKHRVPSYGFLFREKLKERNIVRERIPENKLSLKDILALKRGEDLELDNGKFIPNAELTRDPPVPRSYAYCSDTAYFKRLASFVKGVDVLYHEATFSDEHAALALPAGHSTAAQAARVALEGGVGKLLLGHFSARYKDVQPLVEQAQKIFPETVAVEDNLLITLPEL